MFNIMYKKGDFEGFKILIGMFWSHILSKEESELIISNEQLFIVESVGSVLL